MLLWGGKRYEKVRKSDGIGTGGSYAAFGMRRDGRRESGCDVGGGSICYKRAVGTDWRRNGRYAGACGNGRQPRKGSQGFDIFDREWGSQDRERGGRK